MLKFFVHYQSINSASSAQGVHTYRLSSSLKILHDFSRTVFVCLALIVVSVPAYAQFEGQIAQVCDGSGPSKVFATAMGAPSGSWELFNLNTNTVVGTANNGEYIESSGFTIGDLLEIRDASETDTKAGIINVPEWGGGNPAQNYTTGNANSSDVGCSNQLICGLDSALNLTNGFADGFSNSNPERLLAASSLNGDHNGGFNAVIFGDFTSDGSADSEGRLAVSGNLTIPGSSFSIGIAGGTGAEHAPFGWDNLIVGGNMDFGGRMRGSVLFNNNSSGRLPGFDGIGSGSTGMYRNFTPDIDWTGALNHLKNFSTSLSPGNISIPHTVGTVTGTGDLTLDGNNESRVLVFNVSSVPETWTSFNFVNVSNADAIVVNIGGSTFTKNGGTITVDGSNIQFPISGAQKDFVEKTMWNFYETTNFDLSGYLNAGSVLAPFTQDVSIASGSINGQAVFSGDIQHSGSFEFHNFCFTKSSFLVPEEEILTLTQRNCWRMLSPPFQNLSYNDIIGPLWTQGATGSDSPPPETSAANSNIFLWNKTQPGNSPSDWTTSGLDLNETIPQGEGFLMSIFEDDNNDGNITSAEQFDKEITVSGVPYSSTTITPSMNQNNEGWTLVGNPFNDPVDFGYMVSNGLTNELTDVAYVYNINASGSSNPNTNGNPGGWVSTNGSLGDLHDGKIAVFQGFFVQNDASVSSPSITFTDAARTSGATFYGKENHENLHFIRLELTGDRAQNSAWLSFSEKASPERMKGDAYELVPFKDEYALLASKKGDELFDIGQFPDHPETVIPLHVEATLPGVYSISATDLNLRPGMNLFFKDNNEEVLIPVDDRFSYQFTIDQAVKSLNGISPLTCSSSGEELVKAFTPNPAKASLGIENRFSIIISDKNPSNFELPTEVGLNQNYPNPFNPATVISYQLPVSSEVRLEVYDLVGRKVASLVDGHVDAGMHSVNFDASNLSSGVYIYRLKTGNHILSKKLTIIK